MIRHACTIHLHRPIEQIFPFLVDPQKLLQWQSNLIKIEQLTEGPWRVGSRFRELRMLRKKQIEVQGEVSAFEPNRRLSTRTFNEPHVTVSYELSPDAEGTRLDYQFAMHTNGLMRLLEPVILRSIQKESDSDFEKLKQLVGI